ncbi:MAG TPA: L,D-transpeptidase family protein [Steroidobacteraceae bacterium]|nr:L,D-transpeptidase family protein [Steroidobacteraceae bacterium]
MSFSVLAASLTLALAAVAAHGDSLPVTEPVALSSDPLPVVDRVVVKKTERRMYLMHGGNVVRAYHVQLGLSPTGQKEREGDFRTPEGSYHLDVRNARSDYFLSIKVSYPNAEDVRRARTRHWVTGGSIMIHGFPNFMKHDPEYYQNHDWTDGCIAVSNADMVEIWMLVPDSVPIDIDP